MNEKQIELYKHFIMRKNVHVNMSEPDSRNLLKAYLSSLLMNSGVNHILLVYNPKNETEHENRKYILEIESICTKKPLSKCSLDGFFICGKSSMESITYQHLHCLTLGGKSKVLMVVLDRLHISDYNRHYIEDNFNSIIGYQS